MKLEPVIPPEHLTELGKTLRAELPPDLGEMPPEIGQALDRFRTASDRNYLHIPVWAVAISGLTAVLALAAVGFMIAVVSN